MDARLRSGSSWHQQVEGLRQSLCVEFARGPEVDRDQISDVVMRISAHDPHPDMRAGDNVAHCQGSFM
jgi:hypothetical protein